MLTEHQAHLRLEGDGGETQENGAVPKELQTVVNNEIHMLIKQHSESEKEQISLPQGERVKNLLVNDPLEKKMATHFSCLENPMDRAAWWATATGSQRVKHDWATKQKQNDWCLVLKTFSRQIR